MLMNNNVKVGNGVMNHELFSPQGSGDCNFTSNKQQWQGWNKKQGAKT